MAKKKTSGKVEIRVGDTFYLGPVLGFATVLAVGPFRKEDGRRAEGFKVGGLYTPRDTWLDEEMMALMIRYGQRTCRKPHEERTVELYLELFEDSPTRTRIEQLQN
jgi:hypothetical protein